MSKHFQPGRWLLITASLLALAGVLYLLRLAIYPLFGGKELILRMVGAAITSFLIVALASPRMIRWLMKKKFGDRPEFDHGQLNELMKHKSSTPTMGGLLIVLAIAVSTFIFGDVDKCYYIRMAFLVLAWLGGLGAVDDWYKLRRPPAAAAPLPVAGSAAPPPRPGAADRNTRDGLRSWQKILFQIALAVLLASFIWDYSRESRYADYNQRAINAAHSFYFPFKADPIELGRAAFLIIGVLVIVGSSNAVNLTDGMDGLAAGCMFIVTLVFLVLSWVAGVPQWANQMHLPHVPEAAELTVLCAAMAGSCLGFLWYNCLPAQVFMGDTGSLPLGGLLGYVAVVTRQELMLFIAGGVFVLEALSVLSQVTYFKATHGQRLFRCAPIHHHFNLLGWAESKVVMRFWLLCILCAALAMATLKLR